MATYIHQLVLRKNDADIESTRNEEGQRAQIDLLSDTIVYLKASHPMQVAPSNQSAGLLVFAEDDKVVQQSLQEGWRF